MKLFFLLLLCLTSLYLAKKIVNPNKNEIIVNNDNPRNIFMWMNCIVNCTDLQQLTTLAPYISGVIYTEFSIPNGILTETGLRSKEISDLAKTLNINYYFLIASSELDDIRIIFENPVTFIAQVVVYANNPNVTGVNMDFECGDERLVEEDGIAYYNLLVNLKTALSIINKELTVDFNSGYGSLFWIPDLMKRFIDDHNGYLIQMQTYRLEPITQWVSILDFTKQTYGTSNVGIGMFIYNLPEEVDVEQRFEQICAYGFNDIFIWVSPLLDDWIQPVQGWSTLTNCTIITPISSTNSMIGFIEFYLIFILISLIF